MPPELLHDRQRHRSSNVLSFGVLRWEMYHGQRSWHGKSHEQLISAIAHEEQTLKWSADGLAGLAVRIITAWQVKLVKLR